MFCQLYNVSLDGSLSGQQCLREVLLIGLQCSLYSLGILHFVAIEQRRSERASERKRERERGRERKRERVLKEQLVYGGK